MEQTFQNSNVGRAADSQAAPVRQTLEDAAGNLRELRKAFVFLGFVIAYFTSLAGVLFGLALQDATMVTVSIPTLAALASVLYVGESKLQ
jgi:hypothetical protein